MIPYNNKRKPLENNQNRERDSLKVILTLNNVFNFV